MNFDIEFINETPQTVNYSDRAVKEYEDGMGDRIEYYTERFESEYSMSGGEDIGGLIVYGQDRLLAVYDYENFCGWVV